jgi:hypothetical protein
MAILLHVLRLAISRQTRTPRQEQRFTRIIIAELK